LGRLRQAGSRSEEPLNLLASWTSTPGQEETHADHEEQPRHRSGPEDWFTGSVYFDTVAAPSAGSRLCTSNVQFTPGARTAWHAHPNGQKIWVLEGVGLAQRRGGPIEVIRSGDRVFFEPGEDHWHGAAGS
jgi:quercetin dioxygenase-like cupin family protein